MKWPAVGSYRNMQMRDTVAFFYAQFSQPYANWAPAHSVQACGTESAG